ncbi:MAG: alkaline phosphatase family protein [Thermoanaerobaculia bacterium]|nr:alkaline phosphatase family protein [Thermoanaerobaculia bacterium]
MKLVAQLTLALLGLVPAASSQAQEPAKLVVIVSIDGLSWPALERYAPWFSQGFRRLLTEGRVETACHYQHLNTETGPGHASLATGAPPRVHGIVANRWSEMDPAGSGTLRRFYCTDQPDSSRVPGQPPLFLREIERDGRRYVFGRQRTLETWLESGELGNQVTTEIGGGPAGETLVFDSDDARVLYALRHGLEPVALPPGGMIPGPANLRIETLGDRLMATSPGSRVVSLSGKDRGAIFLAGRDRRHVVYWYDRDTGRYTSSAAYDNDGAVGSLARDLVRPFNTTRAGGRLVQRFGTLWRPLPAPPSSEDWPRPEPNLALFQMPTIGLGFDHDLALDPKGYFNAFYGTPFQDQLLTDLALEFLRSPALRLGRRGVPDLLALSFSANDLASHAYGAESEETLDTLRRLDRELGRLLAALDEIAAGEPRGGVVVALSSDHGFSPLPEVVRQSTGQRVGGRVASIERDAEAPFPNVQEQLNRALADELCLSVGTSVVFGVEGWSLAYDPAVFAARTVAGRCGPEGAPVTRQQVDEALVRVVRALFSAEIERVLLISQRELWATDDEATSFAREDFDAARSGDAFLIPRPYVLSHWDGARGSGHGSHHDYDTHVPLIFWGQPFRPVRGTDPCTPYDLAPTLADLLGLELPAATGISRRR